MKYFTVILLLILIVKVHSQNLVPNYSFESYTNCPTAGGQINYASPWYDPTGATSDYFNACATPTFVGVPFNVNNLGFQQAHSGNAYAGLFTLNGGSNNFREYIQVAINDSLINSRCYYIEFYVSLANPEAYASNNIGAYLSSAPITTSPPNILPYSPQILLTGNPVITDTLNWVKIYGVYNALGGEKYITIGNFSNITNTDIVINDTSTFYTIQDTSSYYYIDDVSIFEIKNVDSGNDTTLCNGNSLQLGSTNYEGVVYNWQPSIGLSNSNIGNPIASPTQTTTYYLTQTTPCAVTKDSLTVSVCYTPPSSNSNITIPNIFTPNNDGINDVFKITSKNIATLNCKIYNRWGILVSELTKTNEAWAGLTTSGMQCASGVYYYVLMAMGEDAKEYNEKGFVQLIK